MKRRLFSTSIVAAVCAVMLVGLAGPAGAYSNNFDSDTAGWFDNGPNTITQVASGYDNPAYADDINSASDGGHARLNRADCVEDGDPPGAGIGPSVNCSGPFTYWGNGGQGNVWKGPYQTQVDIYLDATYADVNEDSDVGNACLLTDPIPVDCKGTRFDYVSAINSSAPLVSGQATHLRDFGFIAGTGQPGNTCTGWVINAQTNSTRDSAFPDDTSKNPVCITESGWYTFKHSFYENAANNLEVKMEIIDVDTAEVVKDATWIIESGDNVKDENGQAVFVPNHISTVGCNRYGWFSDQEISGLPIDNASMTGGCAEPPHIGVIAPTATTCQQYRDNETTPMPVLDKLQYTTKGTGTNTKINAVSPGVFFYYTKVSGDAGQKVDITETNDGTSAPVIPINQGQVVLYDASTCKVVKGWTPTASSDGTAFGNLPKDGAFIIGVKYNPSALKGKNVPSPTTVTYTFGAELDDVAFDAATIDLVPKA
jgi:hypothetical protein